MARALPYTLSLLGVALTVGLIALLRTRFELPTAILLYLVPIVSAAAQWGRGPAALAAVVAALAHDFLFIVPPVGTLTVAAPDEALAWSCLCSRRLSTAQLADAARGAEHGRAAQLAQPPMRSRPRCCTRSA